MDGLIPRISTWMQSVLAQTPDHISSVYIEYGDAFTPKMERLICFNAFGFESLANGSFDPTNKDHVYALGDFTWEPSSSEGRVFDCNFSEAECPRIDWMAVARCAAQSPKVQKLATTHHLHLVIGEHDGEIIVIC